MGNILNTLSAFWRSELVSDNKWIIVLLVVFCVMATEFVCSMVFIHVILPRKRSTVGYLLPEFHNILTELEILKADNRKLKEELDKYKNAGK